MRCGWLPVPGWLRAEPICPRLVRLFPKPPALPGGLSLGQTVHPVVLFWGDNAAGPATCLTGLLWLREKRALSGSSEEPAFQWGPSCPHSQDGSPARPRPLLEQAGPWAQSGCGGLSSRSQLPPVQPTARKQEIRLTLKGPVWKHRMNSGLPLALGKGAQPCTLKCSGSASHEHIQK